MTETGLVQRDFTDVPEIINASESHMALVFLLDVSGSMHGTPIANLNSGLNRFKAEVSKDSQTRDILDIAIIKFNEIYNVVQDFVPVEYMETVNLSAGGGTVMSPAIREALRMVDERSRFYRRSGSEPYKPWVILVTDGGNGDDISDVAREIKDMEEKGRVSFRSLGVAGYCSETLHMLCGPKVMKLEGTEFTDFFNWVGKSMRSVSQSSPGEKPKAVDLEGNVTVDIRRNTDWD